MAEKSGKQPAILTFRQYMGICTHSRTAGKITVIIGGDFHCLLAFKLTPEFLFGEVIRHLFAQRYALY